MAVSEVLPYVNNIKHLAIQENSRNYIYESFSLIDVTLNVLPSWLSLYRMSCTEIYKKSFVFVMLLMDK